MSVLEVKVLKKIIENIPDDYSIVFDDGKKDYQIDDKFEVDVSKQLLILKRY